MLRFKPVLWVMLGAALGVSASMLPSALQAQSTTAGTVLTGGDLGFRVDGQLNGRPFGNLVVRVNGTWVAPESVGKLRPATAQ